jgi:hypothetical protein
VAADRLWVIGIPGRGDLARAQAYAARRGVTFDRPGWAAPPEEGDQP